ncbi:hypothetical protein LEP1GSC013_0678 [Leptospira interrogans serovar Valbuzzi str. Duyster]|nr:hypothetical protein LEP1GSC013_0678 [Leptospira interrogans serovar Valbuzzi str. Duyster]ENO70495.1 hypothetical protein LEP1GSC012_0680 [Leptospira interrogans serovar Valbuzzi str. Valbuzzi]
MGQSKFHSRILLFLLGDCTNTGLENLANSEIIESGAQNFGRTEFVSKIYRTLL